MIDFFVALIWPFIQNIHADRGRTCIVKNVQQKVAPAKASKYGMFAERLQCNSCFYIFQYIVFVTMSVEIF